MDMRDSLNRLLNKATPDAPAAYATEIVEESDAITIAEMNGKLRPANKTLTRIHFVLKDGRVRSYQYAYLDSETTFDGNSFTLLFAGVKHHKITVTGHGPEFWRAYDLISLHRLPYLREATRGFADKSETVFTEIKIVDVTPRDNE